MASLVTTETNRDVFSFINSISNESKKQDSLQLIQLFNEATGKQPKIWGNSKVPDFIIGYGKYAYRRKGSKEDLEWFNVGFAPRSNKITIYLTFDVSKEEEIISKLGKCQWGKGCLYINKLSDVNTDILKQLIVKSKNATWH